jgi:hypothetical protein
MKCFVRAAIEQPERRTGRRCLPACLPACPLRLVSFAEFNMGLRLAVNESSLLNNAYE